MSITDEQIQQLVAGLEETSRKAAELAIKEAMATQFEKWKEAIAGGGPAPPQKIVQIPVIYVGSKPSGVKSVTLLANLLWSKLKPLVAGGGGEGVFNALINDITPDTFNVTGWQVFSCGPAPVTLFTIAAVQYTSITPADITWNTVWAGEQPAIAELKADGDGAMRIEVKEIP